MSSVSSNTNVSAPLQISAKKLEKWQKKRDELVAKAGLLKNEIEFLAPVVVKPLEEYCLEPLSLSPHADKALVDVNNNQHALLNQKFNSPKALKKKRDDAKKLVAEREAKAKELEVVEKKLAKYNMKLAPAISVEGSSSTDELTVEEKFAQLKQETAEAFTAVGQVIERKLSLDRLDREVEKLDQPVDLRTLDEILLEDYRKLDFQKLVDIETALNAGIKSFGENPTFAEEIKNAQGQLAIVKQVLWEKRPGVLGTRTINYLFRKAQD